MLTFLAPKFMKAFDKFLLLNYPFWYIVKIHYILYFTILMWLLSFGIGYLLNIDITAYSPEAVSGTWIFLMAVLAIILFCVWMYHLTIYNNEDHYGKFTKWDDVKFLGVFIIGINLLMSFSYPMQWVLKHRIANTFTDAQLAQHYNALNLGHKYVGNNIDDYQYCGFDVHDTVTYQQAQSDTNCFKNGSMYRDLNKYRNFVCFSPDKNDYDYDLIRFWDKSDIKASKEFSDNMMSASAIEKGYQQHQTDGAKLGAIDEYFKVVRIYSSDNDYNFNNLASYTPKDYLDNYNHYEKACVITFPLAYNYKKSSYAEYEQESYLPSPDVTYQLNNIFKAKFTNIYLVSLSYLRFCFYFSFYASLLMILFRNNRWQHYLVTAVTVILLSIIIGIISLISLPSAYPTLSILVWVVAGFMSIKYSFKKDRYRVIDVVASNIFYIGLPLMPYFLCEYAHEIFGWYKCNFSDVDDIQAQIECSIKEYTFKNICYYARVIGITVFIVLVMPFYKVFFINQKALPSNK